MCLIIFSYRIHPDFRLALAANRDEFYDRPTAPIDFWADRPGILAGRDLKGGGTWMGVARTGRFAAITNYRDPASIRADAPSRGRLVSDYLAGDTPPRTYLEALAAVGNRYNGFNLLVGDADGLFYYSNRGDGVRGLAPGLYGLSNHLLDTPWPKVAVGKRRLGDVLSGAAPFDTEAVLANLADTTRAPDHRLPHTGVGLQRERELSPVFIAIPGYGTRCSSILRIGTNGSASLIERTFRIDDAAPAVPEATRRVDVELGG